MAFTEPSALERLKYMQDAKTVAIVGASDNPSRASYFVATYLLSAAHFKLFFVNPKLDEVGHGASGGTRSNRRNVHAVTHKPTQVDRMMTAATRPP